MRTTTALGMILKWVSGKDEKVILIANVARFFKRL